MLELFDVRKPPPQPAREPADEIERTQAQALMKRLCARDLAALDALCAAYSQRMLAYARAVLSDQHAAEDVVQDALLAAFKGARKAQEGTPLLPWLLTIVRNKALKLLRRSLRRRRRETLYVERQARVVEIERVQSSEDLQLALARLTLDEREVISLRYLEGMAVVDCAQVLGISEGTVKSRTHYALKSLRELMDNDER